MHYGTSGIHSEYWDLYFWNIADLLRKTFDNLIGCANNSAFIASKGTYLFERTYTDGIIVRSNRKYMICKVCSIMNYVNGTQLLTVKVNFNPLKGGNDEPYCCTEMPDRTRFYATIVF
jgi:hypothetical protein